MFYFQGYAKWRSQQLEASGEGGARKWRELNEELAEEISRSAARYRRGLVVLVWPWRREGGTRGDEDGVRLTMDRADCGDFMDCLVEVMTEHGIPYLVRNSCFSSYCGCSCFYLHVLQLI